MALKNINDIPLSNIAIWVNVQELDPESLNGRPYEDSLIEWAADSIGDIPSVGDFLNLKVDRIISKQGVKPEFEKSSEIFVIKTRLLSFEGFEETKKIHCNLIVEPVIDEDLIGKLIKS